MSIKGMIAAVAASVAVLGGGAIVSAPAASADTIGWTINCTTDNYLGGANVGDTIVITMSTDCANNYGWIWNLNDLSGNGAAAAGFLGIPSSVVNSPDWQPNDPRNGDDWYVYSDGSGTTTIVTVLLGSDYDGNPLTVGSIVAATGTNGSTRAAIYYTGGRSASAPRTIWVQGYGRAASDVTCDEGWAPSWELWPNDGQGGWTCSRVVYQDGSGPAA